MALLQARKLERVCGRVAFVGKEPGPLSGSGFPFVADGTSEQAALFGLLAALEACSDEAALVLAADVPRVPEAFLSSLIERAESTDAVALVPTGGGHPQPLCAVWTRRALPALRCAAAEGKLSLRRAIETAGALVLSEQETELVAGFVPGAFRNVNTPEEYGDLEKETA